ncbi:MAG: DUF4258 domain-containing protein [Chitinophagaceae bacterium]|nr:DUF4258 domain-containing protein [Chitinophagaceae bacterium]
MKRSRIIVLVTLIALGIVFFSRNQQRNEPGPDEDAFERNESRLIYTRHARCRMACRQIDESEVQDILVNGKLNRSKSEPNDKPDPKYALEGTTRDGQQVRIVFAPSKKGIAVITVIDLKREWSCDCN